MAIDIILRNWVRRKVKVILAQPGADDLTITKIMLALRADDEFKWDISDDGLRDMIDKIVDELYGNSPQSVFRELTIQHTMQLYPHNTKKPFRAIMMNLNNHLMKYNHDFQGVMISYRNIRLLDKLGKIIDDQPHIHIRVSFKALLFSPYAGCMLKGEVKYIGEDHIALVVLGAFNATILDADLKDIDKSTIENGDTLSFVVKSVDGVVGSMKITGETNADCVHIKGVKDEEADESAEQPVADGLHTESTEEHIDTEDADEEEAALIQGEVEAEYVDTDNVVGTATANEEEEEESDVADLLSEQTDVKAAENGTSKAAAPKTAKDKSAKKTKRSEQSATTAPAAKKRKTEEASGKSVPTPKSKPKAKSKPKQFEAKSKK